MSNGNKYTEECNAMKDGYLMAGLNGLLGKGRWLCDEDLSSSISMSPRSFKESLLNIKYKQLPLGGEREGQDEEGSHWRCGLDILKNEITVHALDREESFLIPIERFGKVRSHVEAGMLPRFKQMGFWRTDFIREIDDEDEESEDDSEFSGPMSVEWEPREEYESEGFEHGSSEDEEDGMEVD